MKFLKLFFLLLLLIFVSGCNTSKQLQKSIIKNSTNVEENIKNINQTDIIYKSKIKELNNILKIYKDSLVFIQGLLEKSQNISEDSSYLETSYSISNAKILKNGKLYHSLFNKDSIPSKIIYIKEKEENNRFIEEEKKIKILKDSINILKQQNLFYKENIKENIIIKNNFWYNIKYFMIGVIFSIFLFIILWLYNKFKGKIFNKI